ncbi:MAG: helix-turn-helix domain-containing protein [Eubacterium sp.]|nr:helix-turn-helix domain-containing protein [Eubacterium sp.]
MISFNPLFSYMKTNNITMYKLIKLNIITATESTRVRCDHNFRLSFINRLCHELNCEPSDLIEFIPDKKQ